MNRIAGMVVAVFVGLIAGCSGGGVPLDSEPPQGSLIVNGARLLANPGKSEQILQMTVESAEADRLIGIKLAGSDAPGLTMYRSFEAFNGTPLPKAKMSFPRPTEQIKSVNLGSGQPVTFAWDGYAAILEGTGLRDPKSTTAEITLDFEKHESVRLSVPVVSE